MSPGTQLAEALYRAPATIGRLSPRAWALAALYLGLAALLLTGLGALLFALEGSLRQAAVGYVVPEGMAGAADLMVRVILRSQTRELLANALVSGSLVFVSLFLFRVKERLSATVERHNALDGGRPYRSLPLWIEAREEIKLALLYAAGFMVVFWLGYHPAPWRKALATTLSYVILFYTWAIDFCAPTMMRHGLGYSQIIKALLARPLAALAFGALFSLPVVATVALTSELAETHPAAMAAIVFGVSVIAMVWAAVAGTWLGARLLPVAETRPRSTRAARVLGWLLVVGILAAGGYVFVAVGDSLHAKSQILKCRYRVDWSSVQVDTPGLDDLGALAAGAIDVGVSFDVAIDNPTPIDVRLEQNRVVLSDGDVTLAQGRLRPLEVPAGETVRQRVGVDVQVTAGALLRGFALDPRKWRVTLYIQLDDAIELPVYLKAGER